jgi:DNA (cytosine-5)-methyltransferase 1
MTPTLKHGLGGGLVPTLNAFDNGDTRATVLIIETPVLMRGREGKEGGGKGALLSHNISLTIATANDQVLFTSSAVIAFEPDCRDGIRLLKDKTNTLQSFMGTGGGNVPAIQEIDKPAVVRRLTPVECERLQGFPDDWTTDQADSNRYKQMGNAVTVTVVAWIGARL